MARENMLHQHTQPGAVCLRFLRQACSQPPSVAPFGRTQMGTRASAKTGDRYGRLTVIRETEQRRSPCGHAERQVLCECDCGNEIVVLLNSLRFGRTKSCGCLANDLTAARNRRNATHGMSNSPTYLCWYSMRQRCNNMHHQAYSEYGGRGITVCERWQNCFENFLEDMGKRPSPRHSIDRVDNDGNYEPGNCRWATVTEQGRNKRNNVLLTCQGETMCLSEWAERVGITPEGLSARLARGWSVEEILTTPSRRGS